MKASNLHFWTNSSSLVGASSQVEELLNLDHEGDWRMTVLLLDKIAADENSMTTIKMRTMEDDLERILWKEEKSPWIFFLKELECEMKLVFAIVVFRFSFECNVKSIHYAQTSSHPLTEQFFVDHREDKWSMLPKRHRRRKLKSSWGEESSIDRLLESFVQYLHSKLRPRLVVIVHHRHQFPNLHWNSILPIDLEYRGDGRVWDSVSMTFVWFVRYSTNLERKKKLLNICSFPHLSNEFETVGDVIVFNRITWVLFSNEMNGCSHCLLLLPFLFSSFLSLSLSWVKYSTENKKRSGEQREKINWSQFGKYLRRNKNMLKKLLALDLDALLAFIFGEMNELFRRIVWSSIWKGYSQLVSIW